MTEASKEAVVEQTANAPTGGRKFSPLAFAFLLMALGGFAYAALGFLGLQEAQIPANWLQTQGQIVNHGIETLSRSKADGSTIEMYKPKITYRYEVDGQHYLGKQLTQHDQERTLKAVAETEIESLTVGTRVSVHYNPDNPADAVLHKSDTLGPIQAISAGLCVGIGCFGIFMVSLRRRAKA